MEYYGHNDWRDYHLAHFGVKGMSWGKHLPGTEWWKNGMNNPQAAAMQNLNASIQNAAAARNPGPVLSTKTSAPAKLGVPAKIQQEINKQNAAQLQNQQKQNQANSESTSNKSASDVDKMADAVINGKYGNGEARKKALEKEGYNWAEVQNKVNEKLGSSVRHAVDAIGSQSVNDSSTKQSAASGKSAIDGLRNVEGHGAKVTNSSSSKSKNKKPNKSKKKSDKEKRKEAAESRQEIRSRKNKTTRVKVNDSRKDNAAAKRRTIRSRLNNTLYNGEDGVMY